MDLRDLVIRTLIGEARSEGDTGMAGVAHVIRNRMNRMRKSADQVILAPAQFSLWNQGNPAGLSAMAVRPDDPVYVRAGQIADGVFNGTVPDVTGGATHYYNPALAAPAWGAQLRGANRIGNHLFGQAPMEGLAPDTGAPSGQPNQPLVQNASYTPPYGPTLTPPLASLPPNYIQPQRNPVTTGLPPASTDELGIDISEYFEGNAKRSPSVPTDPVYENNLLRFLNDNPYGISIGSYQRSYDDQKRLWDAELLKRGGDASLARKWVAPPGRSFHGKGNAADLSYENNEARDWAHANAGKYNLTFPMAHENWHVEPIGARGGGGAAGVAGGGVMPTAGATPAQGQMPFAPPQQAQVNPIATALGNMAQVVGKPQEPLPAPQAHEIGSGGQPDFAATMASITAPPRPASTGTPLSASTAPLSRAPSPMDPLAGSVDPGQAQIMPFKVPQIGTQEDPLALFKRAMTMGRSV